MSLREADFNTTATKLLTLLNVSATRKRKRTEDEDVFIPAKKLNQRRPLNFIEPGLEVASESLPEPASEPAPENDENDQESQTGALKFFFSPAPLQ